MCSKWDIKKFIGSNEFELWNMRAILIQHRCVGALKGETNACYFDTGRKDRDE
jgi:hypothetical protein